MEYVLKCQRCEYFKTVACYGIQKGHRTGSCLLTFQETRRKWVKNLPVEGRVTLNTGGDNLETGYRVLQKEH